MKPLEKTFVAMVVLSCAAVLLLLIVTQRPDRDYMIVYRLPEDFRGYFEVIQSPSGVPIDLDTPKLILDVPASGQLHVSTLDFLERWHRYQVVYPSGKLVPSDGYGMNEDGLTVFNVGNSVLRSLYLIGTKAEYKDHLAQRGRGPDKRAEAVQSEPSP